jgi:hypothetical protein
MTVEKSSEASDTPGVQNLRAQLADEIASQKEQIQERLPEETKRVANMMAGQKELLSDTNPAHLGKATGHFAKDLTNKLTQRDQVLADLIKENPDAQKAIVRAAAAKEIALEVLKLAGGGN